jgi:hypothetical protein
MLCYVRWADSLRLCCCVFICLQAHRATDSSVLALRRSRSSWLSTLLRLALLLLAALAFQYALGAGLLKQYEPALQPVVQQLQPLLDVLQPVTEAVEPFVQQAAAKAQGLIGA